MAGPITVKVEAADALAALERVRAKGRNLRPLLKEIGEDLAASTKARFGSSTAPDGSAWAANSPVTIARWMGGKGLHKKDGDLNARGKKRLAAKKPLVGRSKMLSHTITYRVEGGGVLAVGSPLIYAATHQFGAKMGEFGRYYQLSRLKYAEGDFRRHAGMTKGHPIPWGNIPARPFLGLSNQDRNDIVSTCARYLLGP